MHMCVIKKYVYIRSMKYDCLACLSSSLPNTRVYHPIFSSITLGWRRCIHAYIYIYIYRQLQFVFLYTCIYIWQCTVFRFFIIFTCRTGQFEIRENLLHLKGFLQSLLDFHRKQFKYSDMHRCNDLHAVYNLFIMFCYISLNGKIKQF